jgi:hypothetical protein
LINEPITKDPHGFISPESNEPLFVSEFVNCGLQKSFVDSAQISQVKDVMELNWCSWKFLNNSKVKVQSCLGDLGDSTLNFVSELKAMLLKDLGVDFLSGFS